MDRNKRRVKLDKSVLESQQFSIYMRNDALVTGFYIFTLNYIDIKKFHAKMSVSENVLHITKAKEEERHILSMEAQRLFYNYLASAISMTHHVKKCMKSHYRNTDLYKTFEEKRKSTFDNNPLHCFVEDTRNVYVHVEVSRGLQQVSLDGKLKYEYNINLDRLKKCLRDEKAIAWLNSQDKPLSIKKIADDYYKLVRDFYVWFFEEIRKFHDDDYKNLEEQIRRSSAFAVWKDAPASQSSTGLPPL